VRKCERAYVHARWPEGVTPPNFEETLDAAKVYLHFRWRASGPIGQCVKKISRDTAISMQPHRSRSDLCAGGTVIEFPLRHQPWVTKTLPSHRSVGHRSGAAAVLDQPWTAQRAAPCLYFTIGETICSPGPSSFLSSGQGIFRFSTCDEAAQALAAINADYERHCRAAREIAESHFDSKQNLETILKIALPKSATASDQCDDVKRNTP
jgi:hypothetical protein